MELVILILSYCIGGIPFGYLIAKAVKKIDIRKFGSGNIGATNVTRVVGKKWGITVFFLDFLKGLIPLLLLHLFIFHPSPLIQITVAIGAIAGHNWTPFLRFKGGKGVSTSLGVIAGLSIKFPLLVIPFLLSLIVWTTIFFIGKIVSIASLGAIFTFSITTLFLKDLPQEIKLFSFLIFILALIMHKKNIKNLFTRREFRF